MAPVTRSKAGRDKALSINRLYITFRNPCRPVVGSVWIHTMLCYVTQSSSANILQIICAASQFSVSTKLN